MLNWVLSEIHLDLWDAKFEKNESQKIPAFSDHWGKGSPSAAETAILDLEVEILKGEERKKKVDDLLVIDGRPLDSLSGSKITSSTERSLDSRVDWQRLILSKLHHVNCCNAALHYFFRLNYRRTHEECQKSYSLLTKTHFLHETIKVSMNLFKTCTK